MTPDLERLRKKARKLRWIFDEIELTLVDDPEWGEPSDHSYLRPAELKNPGIAADVAAMAATNKLISWFGKDMGGWVGLWRGPSNHALVDAPVVRLDTEGEYRLAARTIPDWLAMTTREEYFADARRDLIAAGFKVARSRDAVYGQLAGYDRDDQPNTYRDDLSEANLRARKKPAKPTKKKPAPKNPAGKTKRR